ncbi:MAG: hypothetical protein ABJR46_11425 [Tateyamaria sp.]|uniref:hypothetical protein n=1 Tax=Tateyamaria sp. TaxID=1929288 RepID=UPI00329E18AB
MAEVDFSDFDAAAAWFKSQTPEVRCTIASRAALRVAANLGLYKGEHADTPILRVLRCTLTSAVRGLGRTEDVKSLDRANLFAYSVANSAHSTALSTHLIGSPGAAAGVGHSAANSAADSATHSAHAVRSAFSAASSVANSIHSVVESTFSTLSVTISAHAARSAAAWDRSHIKADLNTQTLWAGPVVPDGMSTQHSVFLNRLSKNPDWDFFRTWYEQMWEGTFTDWDLATAVAKIDDDVWDEGLAAVAEAIRGITARRLTETLPQVEEIFETATGVYDVRGTIVEPTKLIGSIANRVQFAMDLAINSNVCDLDSMSTAAKILRHALENCLDDPNALEQFLRQAGDLIRSGLDSGKFGDDDALDVLIRTLDETALQLRADHPDVADAVDARVRQRLRELEDVERLRGAALIEDMREGTTGRLDAEFELAAETTRDGDSLDATAEALKQSGNRAGKISLSERAKKAEGSGFMSSVKIGMRAQNLVEFVSNLFSGGAV